MKITKLRTPREILHLGCSSESNWSFKRSLCQSASLGAWQRGYGLEPGMESSRGEGEGQTY